METKEVVTESTSTDIATSIGQFVSDAGKRFDSATALLAPGRLATNYSSLATHVRNTAAVLEKFGLIETDRVAIVLPNGPDMATAFLAVSAVAISAPLNPGYRAEEFEFFLNDLNARAVIVLDGDMSSVVAVAQRMGVPVLSLTPAAEAGVFELENRSGMAFSESVVSGSTEHIGLVLHTSGTTSRPKIVPLTHANMLSSAFNVSQSLALNNDDRCLNVMPLFHIHGLMAAVLAPLVVGSSVVCTPGFLAPKFYSWLDEFGPSWYTAVPTMHQTILGRAAQNAEIIARRPLRFIRSSSAALPPPVFSELEEKFSAPVIEAYGMTEAAHQMASNPLPPKIRKAGTVGVAAGPDLAIMDEQGNLLGPGATGEIVICGDNVTPGYEGNPEATAAAFTNGWFRTGDQGVIDSDGYLSITGRLKEIINRGGEKVSPREIDELLMTHPAVLQAVAFAVEHPTLGEDVAAAIVLRPNCSVSEDELRDFAAQRIAHYKVPQQFVLVDEIPKGPTGKLQRIGLASKLSLAPIEDVAADLDWTKPESKSELLISGIWADVLGLDAQADRPALGIHSRFLDLGGDSMLAAQVATRINNSVSIDLPLSTIFATPTVARLSEALDTLLWMQNDSSGTDGEQIEI